MKVNRNPYVLAAGVLCALVSPNAQASVSKGIIIGATGLIGAYTAWKGRQSMIHQPKMVRVWYRLDGCDPNGTLSDVKKHGLTVSTGVDKHFMYYDFWVKEADGSISSSWAGMRPGPHDIGFDVDPQRTKVRDRVFKHLHDESGYRASEGLLLDYMKKMKKRSVAVQMDKELDYRVGRHNVTGVVTSMPSHLKWSDFCQEIIINKHIDPKDLHFYDEQGNETK